MAEIIDIRELRLARLNRLRRQALAEMSEAERLAMSAKGDAGFYDETRTRLSLTILVCEDEIRALEEELYG